MALQLNLTDTNVGLPAPQAYARIVAYAFNAKTNEWEVAVDVYASSAARTAGKSPVSGGVFKTESTPETVPADAGRAALYSWLKTQDAFSGAIDV